MSTPETSKDVKSQVREIAEERQSQARKIAEKTPIAREEECRKNANPQVQKKLWKLPIQGDAKNPDSLILCRHSCCAVATNLQDIIA